MALKKCKECGTDVSASAKTCPNCGVSNPGVTGKEILQGLVGLIVIIVVIAFFVGGEDEQPQKASVETKQPEQVTSAQPNVDRLEIAKQLTEKAKQASVNIEFSVDPNDDKTLALYRVSNLKPEELEGDWTMYLLSIGTSTEYLKQNGFNKVRIYTTQSKDISDYVLKIL